MSHPSIRALRQLSAMLALALLATACSGSAPPQSSGPTGTSGTGGISNDNANAVAGELKSRGECQEPTGAGTDITEDITADTTWTAEQSPYRIKNNITLRATLTLKPCTLVLLAERAQVFVGSAPTAGKLVAQGEAEERGNDVVLRPVVFAPLVEGKAWGAVVVDRVGFLDAQFTAFVQGGHKELDRAAIVARGNRTTAMELVKNVRVRGAFVLDSQTDGVQMLSLAGFTDDSILLAVLDSGADNHPNPLWIEAGAVGTIPPDSVFQGNTRNEVLVDPFAAAMLSDHFKALSIPYRILGPLYVGADTDGTTTTLTIDAGATLGFDSSAGSGLLIGNSAARLGLLVANGTADKPIVFTSAKASKAPGDWLGIYFRYSPESGNTINYARIEFAGAPSGAQGYGCGPIENDASVLLLASRPSSAFITNTTFANAGGDTQILSGWASDADGPVFTATNTFAASPACRVSKWQRVTGVACPLSPAVDCY